MSYQHLTQQFNRNHLHLFRAVAEAGSFSRAAEHLLISQPAVSQQVAELEKHVGIPLLDRLPRGVQVTPAGAELLAYAQRIAALETAAFKAMQDASALKRGRLAVGASTTIGVYLLPKLLAQFRSRHPNITPYVQIDNTTIIQQSLLDGSLHLALTEGFAEHELLQARTFYNDELAPIVPMEHSFARRESITLAEMAKQPLILRERGSGTRAVVERAAAKRNITLTPLLEISQTQAIKNLVAAGVGCAIVSKLALSNEPPRRLALLKFSDANLQRPLHLLTVNNRTPGQPAEAFIKMLH